MSQVDQWMPWPASDMRVYTERTPDNLHRASEQFCVESHLRYRPSDGKTWCNCLLWDVTRALGCEIPHWVDAQGRPAASFAPGSRELSANGVYAWLEEYGLEHGWQYVESRHLACMRADLGYPTVAAWRNPRGHGHVALVLPGDRVVQAGIVNGVLSIDAAFGTHVPSFWTHP